MKILTFKTSPIMPEAFENPPEGIEIIDSGIRTVAMSAEVLTWANFQITITFGVPASIAANFIYDAIKKRSKKTPDKITINQTTIRFEKGELIEFIEKKVTETKS